MRNPMKLALVALAFSLPALCAPSVLGQQKKSDDEEKTSIWMKKKLEFSHEILSGLTKGDFEMVATNAQAMNILNYLERWSRADKAGYKQQITYFDMANRELIKHAKEKNIEGSVLAYNQLTISCVQCHKLVRDKDK